MAITIETGLCYLMKCGIRVRILNCHAMSALCVFEGVSEPDRHRGEWYADGKFAGTNREWDIVELALNLPEREAEPEIAALRRRVAELEEKLNDPGLVKREPGEPMFVLLGRDSAAPEVIYHWCAMRKMQIWTGERPDNEAENSNIDEVRRRASEFRRWRKENR